ncbi:hypothetical protein B0T21DRAFT_52437 [Apiosordaria backusii]|uniref:Uncharacterized protein n=1 Tax=Apiosordaria backusii TaxID=314023 RepID=A0AA40E240_9PEZI|nr:hypothetical protein B0T21DRAFT_52437 [Apiosordaria backusii]
MQPARRFHVPEVRAKTKHGLITYSAFFSFTSHADASCNARKSTLEPRHANNALHAAFETRPLLKNLQPPARRYCSIFKRRALAALCKVVVKPSAGSRSYPSPSLREREEMGVCLPTCSLLRYDPPIHYDRQHDETARYCSVSPAAQHKGSRETNDKWAGSGLPERQLDVRAGVAKVAHARQAKRQVAGFLGAHGRVLVGSEGGSSRIINRSHEYETPGFFGKFLVYLRIWYPLREQCKTLVL